MKKLIGLIFMLCCLLSPTISHGAEPVKIACIIPSYPNIDFWSDIETGMTERAAQEDAQLLMLYTKSSVSGLAMDLNTALSIAIHSDVDAIITSYTLAVDGTAELLDEALEKDIPVIMIDCDSPEDLRTAFVGIDNHSAGQQIGSIAASSTDSTGKVLLVYSETSFSHDNLAQRITGIQSALDDHTDYDIYVISTFSVETSIALRQLLAEDPSIETIIAVNENSTVLCAQAVAGLQSDREIYILGFDQSEETTALLENGVIDLLACQKPDVMGADSISTAVALAKGDASQEGFHWIQTQLVTSAEEIEIKETAAELTE